MILEFWANDKILVQSNSQSDLQNFTNKTIDKPKSKTVLKNPVIIKKILQDYALQRKQLTNINKAALGKSKCLDSLN